MICSLGGRGMPLGGISPRLRRLQDLLPGRLVGLKIVGIQRHHRHARGLGLVVVTGRAVLHQHVLVIVGRDHRRRGRRGREHSSARCWRSRRGVSRSLLPENRSIPQRQRRQRQIRQSCQINIYAHLPAATAISVCRVQALCLLMSDPPLKVNCRFCAELCCSREANFALQHALHEALLPTARNNGLAFSQTGRRETWTGGRF